MRLIENLVALGQDCNDNIEYLNAGGCCVYAAHVAKRLHALHVPTWGIVGQSWGNRGLDLNEIRRNNRPRTTTDWNRAGVHFTHVLVQFVHDGKVWTHDSNRTVPEAIKRESTCYSEILPGLLTTGELTALASKQEGWNRMFDREAGIPVIQSNVRKYLSTRALRA
jgi:hypothetical protein